MLFETAARKGKAKKTIIFDSLIAFRKNSNQDVKNLDAIDLVIEDTGKKGKATAKAYTFRPCEGDEDFFDMIIRNAQPKKSHFDIDKMPEDDESVDI